MSDTTEKEVLQRLILAQGALLEVLYGVIRDIEVLGPEDRNREFLLKNVKAKLETRLALAKQSGNEMHFAAIETAYEKLDELLHEAFPMKLRNPTLVPPSALPNLGEPSTDS